MHGFFVQLEGLPYTYTLICNTPESGNNAILEAPPDLRPPVSKRHKGIGTVQCYTSPFEHLVFLFFLDLTGLAGVEHHLVDLLKWEDENRVIRELKIYSKIAHRWRQIATRLGFELGEIDSIEENHHRNHSRVTTVLSQWFDNAVNLPNASRYPKSWPGLINLLEDVELGEVAEELRTALSSPRNSVRGKL